MLTEAKKISLDIAYRNYCENNKITSMCKTGQHEGNPCFIIGGGKSLEGFDFKKLQGKYTIGINKSFIYFDSTFLYIGDLNFYQGIQRDEILCKKWNDFKGTKVLLAPQVPNTKVDCHVVMRKADKELPSDLEDGIPIGNNSGFGALILGYLLGFNPIYLLGFDLQGNHWHEGYGEKEIPKDRYTRFIIPFQQIADSFMEKGIEVINLNPKSVLQCFKKKRIEEILS